MKLMRLLLIALFLIAFTSSCMMGGPHHLDQQHSDNYHNRYHFLE